MDFPFGFPSDTRKRGTSSKKSNTKTAHVSKASSFTKKAEHTPKLGLSKGRWIVFGP